MGSQAFDRKFGAELLRELPPGPAVYLFKDAEGAVIYAGKAKNIRRRLAGYRNLSRRRTHRKMRRLVGAASTIEIRLQDSEHDALLLENELIRTLRPRFNVDGAFSFLYPAVGVGARGGHTLLCFTTHTDAFAGLELRWHGSFRSRLRTLAAFEGLVALLEFVGHREPNARLPGIPRLRGSRVAAFRRIEALAPSLESFFAGESDAVLAELARRLLEKPDARHAAAEVGEELRRLAAFFASDARKLRDALHAAGRDGAFVVQGERDAFFIRHRSER